MRCWSRASSAGCSGQFASARGLVTDAFPSSGYVAAATAAVTFAAPWMSRRWRRTAWGGIGLLVVLRLATRVVPAGDVLLAVGVGAVVGSLALLLFGSPNLEPSPEEVTDALRGVGLDPRRVSRTDERKGRPAYHVVESSGRRSFVKLRTPEDRDADFLSRVLPGGAVPDRPPGQPVRVLEAPDRARGLPPAPGGRGRGALPGGRGLRGHRGRVRLPGRGAGGWAGRPWTASWPVRGFSRTSGGRWPGCTRPGSPTGGCRRTTCSSTTPRTCGWSTSTRPRRRPNRDSSTATSPTCWSSRRWPRGWGQRWTPRCEPWVATRSPLRSRSSSPSPCRSTLRRRVRQQKELLTDLRHAVQQATGATDAHLARLERIRPRTLLVIVGSTIAFYSLLPQLGNLGDTAEALRTANVLWLAVLLAASVLTYVFATVSFLGSVPQSPAGGADAAGPGGGVVRHARRSGQLRQPGAGGPLPAAIGGPRPRGHGGGGPQHGGRHGGPRACCCSGSWSGPGSPACSGSRSPTPTSSCWCWPCSASLVGLALLVRPLRQRILVPAVRAARTGLAQIGRVFRSPARVIALFGGSAALTLAYIGGLMAAVAAFGGDLTFPQVGTAYLAATAIAALAPTPGGLGAVESALIAALTGYGLGRRRRRLGGPHLPAGHVLAADPAGLAAVRLDAAPQRALTAPRRVVADASPAQADPVSCHSPAGQDRRGADLDPAPRSLGDRHLHRGRRGGGHDLVGDLGGQGLCEHGPIPERPEVELQRLALDAPRPGVVLDHQVRQVGLTGHRADGRQLVGGEPHREPVRRRREALDVLDRVADGAAEDGERSVPALGRRVAVGVVGHRLMLTGGAGQREPCSTPRSGCRWEWAETDFPQEDTRMANHPSGTITIDCATCVMRHTATCDDCVVTFLCEREPSEAVLLDLSELQALRRLAHGRAGAEPAPHQRMSGSSVARLGTAPPGTPGTLLSCVRPSRPSRRPAVELARQVEALGLAHGLAAVGIAPARPLRRARPCWRSARPLGLHDGMAFTYRNPERSTTPERVVAGAAAIVVGARRYPSIPPPAPRRGRAGRAGGPLRLERPVRTASRLAAADRRSPAGPWASRRGRGRRQRTGRSRGRAPGRHRLVREERQPAAPGRRRAPGSCSAASSPARPSRPRGRWWRTGAGRAVGAWTGARPGPSSHRVSWTPADAWRGWCRSRVPSPGSTARPWATASTAATTARRCARPNLRVDRAGHRAAPAPAGPAGSGRGLGAAAGAAGQRRRDPPGPSRALVPGRPRPPLAAPQRAGGARQHRRGVGSDGGGHAAPLPVRPGPDAPVPRRLGLPPTWSR